MVTQKSKIAIPGAFVRVIEEDLVIQVLDISKGVVEGIAPYPHGGVAYPNERQLFQKASKPDGWPDYSDRIVPYSDDHDCLRQQKNNKNVPKTASKYRIMSEILRNSPFLTRKQATTTLQAQFPTVSANLCSTYFYKAKRELEL